MTKIDNKLYEQAKHERRMGVRVTPEGLARAVNREMRSREKLSVEPEPIIVSKPIGHAAALAKVTQLLYDEYQQNRMYGSTVGTLAHFLETYEGLMLEQAWRRGQPLPKDLIRAALTKIFAEGEARRKAAK